MLYQFKLQEVFYYKTNAKYQWKYSRYHHTVTNSKRAGGGKRGGGGSVQHGFYKSRAIVWYDFYNMLSVITAVVCYIEHGIDVYWQFSGCLR